MRKSFLIYSRNFLSLRKGWETCCKENIFCLTEIAIIFTEIYRIKAKPKNNYKISDYLTQNTFLIHPENLPLKEIAYNEFKFTHTKAKRPNQ